MMPNHDRTRDGNVFTWILAAAQAVREQRAEERARQTELKKRALLQPAAAT
jgi:hypothetical protein